MATSSEIEKLQRRWDENPLGLTFAPLAEAYRKSGDLARALELLEIGLAQHPHYVPAHIVRGRCHLDAHSDAEAEVAFLRVTELDAENVIALRGLAEISERAGRLPDAIRRLEMLLEIDRNNEDARGQLDRLRELLTTQSDAGVAPAPDMFGVSDGASGASTREPTEVIPEEVMRAQAFDASSLSDLRILEPDELTAAGSTEFQRPGDAESLRSSEDRLPDVVLGSDSPEMDASTPEPEPALAPRDWSPIVTEIYVPLVEVQPPPPEPPSVPEPESSAPLPVMEPELEQAPIPEPVAEPATVPEVEPVPETQPVMETEPVTEAELLMEPEPVIEPEPVMRAEPMPAPEPVPAPAAFGGDEAPKLPWWEAPPEPMERPTPAADPAPEPEPAMVSEPLTESAAESASEPEAASTAAEPELVVTETMAEIFLRQGHRELALAVYSQLAQRDPSNERIAAAVASLHSEIALAPAPPSPSPHFDASTTGGRSVEQLFAALLSATRPSVAATVHPPAFEPPRRPAGEPTRPAQESLSLSAVFGEEAAQARPAGVPAEAREGEPSFDEFFAPASGASSDAELPKAAPAEGAATPAQVPEDLEQFNAWLRGLKR